MADSGFRLLLILQKLPYEPRCISSQQIQKQLLDEGYDVTIRTIQRDLSSLSTHFSIVQTPATGRGKEGSGWAFCKNSRIGIPLMDSSAALTLLMGMTHLQQVLPPQIMQHLQPLKVEAQQTFKQNRYGKWLDKVRVVPQQILQAPQVDAASLDVIYGALLDKQQFSATYNGKVGQILHPYGLVQRGGTLYLLCRFFQFDDVRITALHRFSEVQLLESPVRPFPDFDIDDYLDDGIMQWPIKDKQPIALELRINRWLIGHVKESVLSADQHIQADTGKDGWFRLSAHVVDSYELRWWLLSQGDALEVIAPQPLRQWFATVARNMSSYY